MKTGLPASASRESMITAGLPSGFAIGCSCANAALVIIKIRNIFNFVPRLLVSALVLASFRISRNQLLETRR